MLTCSQAKIKRGSHFGALKGMWTSRICLYHKEKNLEIRLALFERNYPELPKPGYKMARDAIEANLLFKVLEQSIFMYCISHKENKKI